MQYLLVFVAFMLALLVPATVVAQYVPPSGSPLAKREHPRIFLTQESLPLVRAKLAGPMRAQYQAFVKHLEGQMASTGDEQYHAMNYAFVYRVGPIAGVSYKYPDTVYAARAKQALFATNVTLSRAIAYDWLHDFLTPAERQELGSGLSSTAPKSGTNPLDDGEILSRSAYVLAGLAFWGDGVNDLEADKRVRAYQTLIHDTALPLHNAIAADDGGWSQGMDYAAHGPRGNITALVRVLEAWRTSNGLSKAAVYGGQAASVLRYYPQWVAYSIFPETTPADNTPDRKGYRLYKTHHMPPGMWAYGHASQDSALNSLRVLADVDSSMTSLAQWLTDSRTGNTSVSGVKGTREALFAHFVFGEALTPKSPTQLDLPLTKKFDGLGWVAMRTSWDDPNATMVTFTASPWSRAVGAYTNQDQGSFTINRRGPLVTNSGDSVHHGYANTTWASNTMIFPDPNDPDAKTAKYQDLGGQRNHGNPELVRPDQLVPGSAFDIGGIKRFQAAGQTGTDVDYMFADLTRAYSSSAFKDHHNSAKVQNFTRQFLYFRRESDGASDFVVVYDRTTTTDPRFEKRWLLHTSGDPGIDGTPESDGPGRVTYHNARVITQENTAHGSNGKLFVTSLLPLHRKIVKVGGALEGSSPFGPNGFAFVDPYGKQEASTKNSSTASRHQYIGTHRVEVTSTNGGPSDQFLHVLEATHAGVTSAAQAVLLSGAGVAGARFNDRIVLFRSSEGIMHGAEVSVDKAGTYRVVVADLEPGREYVVGGGPATFANGAGIVHATVTIPLAGSPLTVAATGLVAALPSPPRNLRTWP